MQPLERGGDESRLMQAARADPDQFAPIFERYVGPLYRYCAVRLWSREQAEDATSQTFVKALAALDSYRGGSVPAWLFAIARTTVIDIQRRRQRELTEYAPSVPVEIAPSPEAALMAAEDARWLHAALTTLTADQQEVLTLRLAGLNAVEIAAATGRTPGAVRALQFRAVAELKRRHAMSDGGGGGV